MSAELQTLMPGWQRKRLSDLYAIPSRNGLYKPSENYGKGHQMVHMPQMFRGPVVDVSDAAKVKVSSVELNRFGLQEGDLLFARRSLTLEGAGQCSLVPSLSDPVTFESSIIRVRLDDGIVSPTYANFFLGSEIGFRRRLPFIRQVAVSGVSSGDIAAILFDFPTLTRQRKITTILTTLDEVIEATEKLVEKHQQIKAGLMHDLFTRGLWTRPELARGDHKGLPSEAAAQEGQLRPPPEEAPALYQDSPIGLIPKAWSYASIADIGIVKGGKRLPAGTPFSETPTAFPYLRVTDMIDGWIDDSALEFVDPWIEPIIANYKIHKNDIYVTIAGTLGQFGRIPAHLDGAQLTENAAKITEIDQKRVQLDFTCAFLRSNLMAPQKFKAYGLGAGVPKLALYQIEKFVVPLPPIEEQKIAESVLASTRNDIQTNKAHLAKLLQQKQGLMHDLLTGRISVDAIDLEALVS